MQRSASPRSPHRRGPTSATVHEVPEFIVRRADGHIHPAMNGLPGSGFTYSGTQQWQPETPSIDAPPIDLEAIYSVCLVEQRSLIVHANELCAKRNMPELNLATTETHSWEEVEDSVTRACKALEALAAADKAATPGFTGKLRSRFRSLCSHAGAGSTLSQMVPSDSYFSVLAGGLKVIFKALEQTGLYRQEVYAALEELPFILNDNAALLELHGQDEELHRRIAGLYAAIYKFMDVIISWFLKPSLVTGAKIFINPSGFTTKLKDTLDGVKRAAQRFAARVAFMSAQGQQHLAQQNNNIMFMQSQEFGKLKQSNLMVLELLHKFLDSDAKAELERREFQLRVESSGLMQQSLSSPQSGSFPGLDVDDILERYLYESELVPSDCEKVLRLKHVPGHDIDDDLIATIQSHPRFTSWLMLNESSVVFVDTRYQTSIFNHEMPIVGAQIFRKLRQFASEQARASDHGPKIIITEIVCSAFFCSQHRDTYRDANATPAELVMSLLLQTLDQQQQLDPQQLGLIFSQLDPTDAHSVACALEAVLSALPANVIVVLVVDDLRAFMQPAERQRETVEIVARLLEFHRRGQYEATVKIYFGNSTRVGGVEDLFFDNETLRIWAPVPGAVGW